MKDSQPLMYTMLGGSKYIKANNERFSTYARLVSGTY